LGHGHTGTPALARRDTRRGSESYHRYGEVKTCLTIDISWRFGRCDPIEAKLAEGSVRTKVTCRGRITIPKRVRDLLGISPGDSVEFRAIGSGCVIIEKTGAPRPQSRFAELVGVAGLGLSTDEIMALTRGE
jgi:antitoxin PrlF